MKFEEIKRGMLISYDDNLYRSVTYTPMDQLGMNGGLWILLMETNPDNTLNIFSNDVRLSKLTAFDIDAMTADQ